MAEAMSASAKRRARQKAAAAAAAEAPAPPPAPTPAPKAEPAAKSKAKAKAKAAEPAAQPAAPKAEPKAKGKAKAEPKAAAAPAPEPKAAATKAKAKAKGKAKAEQAPPPKKEEENPFIQMDDGTGGDWEVADSISQKEKKRREKKAREAEEKKAAEAAAAAEALQKEIDQKKAEAAAKKAAAKKAASAPAKAVVEVKATPAPAATPAATAAKKAEEKPEEPDPNVTVVLEVDSSKIGRVIGPKGSNIELIKNKTNVKTVDTQGGQVTIIGLPADVELAKGAVTDLVEKGYMTLSYEDFKSGSVTVPTSALPSIIGTRGAVIQAIKKECTVEINIPQDNTGKKPPKTTIAIAGESAGVTKATEIIASLGEHGYHEVTHPGYAHQEMKVEEHKYRFLIGKGGSEMRHIQNNYKVQVKIPREKPGEDPVVVTGDAGDVDRAVKYMEKILLAADEPKPTRENPERRTKEEDQWGGGPNAEEGPEEAWMKAYMRKPAK